MKKRIIGIFAAAVLISAGSVTAFAAARHGHHSGLGAGPSRQEAVCGYVDADGDGICDGCLFDCDADGDGFCDYRRFGCDADEDGLCDHCLSGRDMNGDGLCDSCLFGCDVDGDGVCDHLSGCGNGYDSDNCYGGGDCRGYGYGGSCHTSGWESSGSGSAYTGGLGHRNGHHSR